MTYQAWRKVHGRTQMSGSGFIVPAVGGGTFPVNGILDNFNRANEGPPPSTNWTTGIDGSAGSFTVFSNEAKVNNGTFSSVYWNASTFGPDVEVFATFGSAISNCRVYWRVTSPGASYNGYFLQAYGTPAPTDLYIYRVDGGSLTQLGASIAQSVASGDSFGVSHIGSTITIYYKTAAGSWTSLGTRTDGTYNSAGRIGMAAFDNSSGTLDDFGGGNR